MAMRWLLLLLLLVAIDGWGHRPRWSARKLPKYREVFAQDEGSGQPRAFLVREDVLIRSGFVRPNGQRERANGDGSRIEAAQLQKWLEAGWGFPSTEDGIRQLEMAERRERIQRFRQAISQRPLLLEAYFNRSVGGERVMVRMDAIDELQDSPEHLEALVKQGRAFYEYSALASAEQQRRRAQSTAEMLSADRTMQSAQWKRFNNVTATHEASSLRNAISEYIFDSAGRNPETGEMSQYVKRPGYVGTLPPGETFEDADSAESLPKKVLHPWPALQEISYSVRWPVPHPYSPPSALFIALNNMYTDTYKAEALARTSPVIGGSYMDAYDAIRIAQRGGPGRSYDPSEQLEHGGLRYDKWQLPHYKPDHGPTVSEEEARLDLPPDFQERLQPWVREDGIRIGIVQGSAQQQREAEEEARWRAERLAEILPRRVVGDDEAQERQAMEDEVARRVAAFVERNRRNQSTLVVAEIAAQDVDNPDHVAQPRVVDLEAVLQRRTQRVEAKIRRQILQRRSVLSAAEGVVRDPQAILDYVVESVRGIDEEMSTRSSGEIFAQRRSNRKRLQRLRRRMAHEEGDVEEMVQREAVGEEDVAEEPASPLADFFDEMASP